jgi:hypothetical protein
MENSACSAGGREEIAGLNFDADNYDVTGNNWNISDYHSHDGKKERKIIYYPINVDET